MYTFWIFKIKKGNTRFLVASFLKKSFWKKEELQLPPFLIPVQVLINTGKVLEGSKNKKEVENDLLSIMAPPAGLEPATL